MGARTGAMLVIVLLAVAAMAAGLFLLEWGAERFTAALALLARRLHASDHTVGLLTAGGEWEELVVVLIALVSGHQPLAIGNVIGSCLANVTGSLPLGFLGPLPLRPDRGARVYGWVLVGVTLVAGGFLASGHISPAAGTLLVALFALYLVSVLVVIRRGWLRPLEDDDDDEDVAADTPTGRLVLALVIGLAVTAGAAELVVEGAAQIAHVVGLSDYAIGATVVAIGTTLPDKAISFIGGRRGQSGIVTANATGSNIFLLTLVLGLAALAGGPHLGVPHSVTHVDLPLLVGVTALVALLFHRPALHRGTGIALLLLYAGYLVYSLAAGTV